MSLNIKNCAPVTPTPLEKIKENVTKAGAWIWEHKKWVVLAVATTTGVILLVKKRTAIKDFFQSLHIEKLTAKSAVSEIAEENVPSIPCDALSHRTGNMLTATKLGGKVGVSNREINKRLVAAGLAVRLPCGDYVLTENGKLLGESGLKVTPWNYTAQLIQWDEAVLDIIFTPEELTAIADRQKRIQEILNKTTA